MIGIAGHYGRGKEQQEWSDEPIGEISVAKDKEEEVEWLLEA